MKKFTILLMLMVMVLGCDPDRIMCYDTYYVTERNWSTGETERIEYTVEYECEDTPPTIPAHRE